MFLFKTVVPERVRKLRSLSQRATFSGVGVAILQKAVSTVVNDTSSEKNCHHGNDGEGKEWDGWNGR